jgi:hypothetical protein
MGSRVETRRFQRCYCCRKLELWEKSNHSRDNWIEDVQGPTSKSLQMLSSTVQSTSPITTLLLPANASPSSAHTGASALQCPHLLIDTQE